MQPGRLVGEVLSVTLELLPLDEAVLGQSKAARRQRAASAKDAETKMRCCHGSLMVCCARLISEVLSVTLELLPLDEAVLGQSKAARRQRAASVKDAAAEKNAVAYSV